MAANVIMASSTKTHIPNLSQTPNIPKPKFQNLSLTTPNFPKVTQMTQLAKFAKTASVSLATVLAVAPVAMAVEIEKAQLFDFDFTLPIIATEFLLLMVALDKVYYSPLGGFMDKRDSDIKEKLASVKDTSAEVKQLEEQAAAVMRAARAEISAALNKMKRETTLEVEQKIAEGRKNIEVELQEALAGLAKQKEDTIKALESQIAALSQDIVKKVLPS